MLQSIKPPRGDVRGSRGTRVNMQCVRLFCATHVVATQFDLSTDKGLFEINIATGETSQDIISFTSLISLVFITRKTIMAK